MNSPNSAKPSQAKTLSPQRRLRRALVRLRTSPFSVPVLLLVMYSGLMIALTWVADNWIVALAITPLVFALLITLGCLIAYRRDFYA